MLNRFGRAQDLELPRLAQAPAHPILIQMLSMAQKSAGKTITVSWKTEPSPDAYVLEAVFIDDQKEFVGRRTTAADSREPRWTLSIESEEKSEEKRKEVKRTELWSHVSGDVGLILNLIWSETTGTNQETAESMFLTMHTAKLGRVDRAPERAYTARPATSEPPTEAPVPASTNPTQSVPQNVTLVGQLAEIDLSGIFQSIMICKMTGRLDIQDRLNQAEIFFDDGACIHAQVQNALTDVTRTITGDQALLTVLTWDEGSFLFQKDRKTSERSVKRRIEGLLLEGASLRDYHKYLRGLGVSEDSVLHKKNPALSVDEVRAKLVDGVPIDPAVQKNLYDEIDGKKSLSAIVDALGMAKTLWTPIVFNLFCCELIASDRGAKIDVQHEDLAPPIDNTIVAQARRSLVRPETGLFTFPLFIHFMEQEIARLGRGQSAFSVIVFELKNVKDALSNQALQRVAECFDSVKEKFDIISHYKVFDFVMLLPLRTDEECREFVSRFVEALKQTSLDGVQDPEHLNMAFGISCATSDKDKLSPLLGAAELAKNDCLAKSVVCLTARDARWDKLFQQGNKALSAKNYAEAESAWVAACNEAEHFAPTDLRLMQTIEALVNLQLRQDRFAAAEALLELLVSLQEQAYGAKSVQVANTSSELARCHYLQGKYHIAEPILRNNIQLFSSIYGSEHIACANAMYNLGTLLQVQNRLHEVVPIFKKVLDIRSRVLGAEHPETVKVSQQYDTLMNTEDGADLFTTGSFKTFIATDDLK